MKSPLAFIKAEIVFTTKAFFAPVTAFWRLVSSEHSAIERRHQPTLD
jgi:hypothetical protein